MAESGACANAEEDLSTASMAACLGHESTRSVLEDEFGRPPKSRVARTHLNGV
jgi:hypothetical protein